MPTKSFKASTPVAKGTSKVAKRAVQTATKQSGTYSIVQPRNSYKDFMIVEFSKGSPADIYAELKLYYEFGQRGISPMIYFVKVKEFEEPLTLSKFVRLFDDKQVSPVSYLVEQSNCSDKIFVYYGSDFVNMFSNLRQFIEEKIVANGLVNTDIKIPNLCIDGLGNFKLIDLDPNFIQKIQRDPLSKKTLKRITIDDSDYVDYMLFQVYANMCVSGRMQHDPQLFGRFFTRESLIQTIDRLSFFEAAKEYSHPLNTLLWYTQTGKTRNQYSTSREMFDDIMRKFGAAVPNGDTQTALTLSPTAPSPTAPSSIEYSNQSMSPSVFRVDAETYDIHPMKLFESPISGGRRKKMGVLNEKRCNIFSRKKKKGGGWHYDDPNDRRKMKANNMAELRTDISNNKEVDSDLRLIEREVTNPGSLEKHYYFFSKEEVKNTKDQIKNCLDTENTEFTNYLLDLEWLSTSSNNPSEDKSLFSKRVQKKAQDLLEDLCPAKIKDQPEKENEKEKTEQQDNINKCTENLVTNNPSIIRAKALDICSTLNGVLSTTKKRDIPEKFDNLLHEWFLDRSIIEEIFKTIRSDQLCFLHYIVYKHEEKKFKIFRNAGRTNLSFVYLDPKQYYEDQIVKQCKSKLIAIPLEIHAEEYTHATIIIIDITGKKNKDGKTHIIIEHFDSSTFSDEYNIEEEIEKLVIEMFGNEKYTFEFVGQIDICPFAIQSRLRGTKYSGSCTQFQLWYAFKRLLEPYKSRKQIIEEMDVFLDNGVDGMIQLIQTFQKLVEIKMFNSDDKNFTGTVGTRKFTHLYQEAGNKRTRRRLRKKTKILN
jgi:hypothetical protein